MDIGMYYCDVGFVGYLEWVIGGLDKKGEELLEMMVMEEYLKRSREL